MAWVEGFAVDCGHWVEVDGGGFEGDDLGVEVVCAKAASDVVGVVVDGVVE